MLAIFNLFPGYPLDGGRVLRAILWRRTGDIREATRLAGICGMLIAAILIIFGVYMIVAPNFRSYFMGLWSVLVGLFCSMRPTAWSNTREYTCSTWLAKRCQRHFRLSPIY
jgi:Zn-dependent protease